LKPIYITRALIGSIIFGVLAVIFTLGAAITLLAGVFSTAAFIVPSLLWGITVYAAKIHRQKVKEVA
jgi:uncharacterized membrane protein YoaK (UPF0700 family)